ncbi:hypothetical protein [Planomonospora parontospora]|uniref:hypothetical protein n=1 Tax=Planomonospora parontospora TaxID=58119 RepID=UPI001670A388|nr:hypothetical protein [Planomonospora parontospora]GGL19201.1 hypothetical protein GCM10014719_21650 [Planomonospora parontospora subsp. antibiotica]GII15459.1 hypothetical protein Ppa05_21850 [Planomonospora parontospora subsp. antibiotica]
MGVKERTVRRWTSAPGLLLIGSQVTISLLLLYAGSFPGLSPLWVLPAFLAFFMIGAIWFVRFVVVLSRQESRPDLRRNLLRWAAPPIVGVLMFASTGVVKQSRFALSEESFEKVAHSAMKGSPDWKTGAMTLGLFDVSWATRHENAVRFALAGGGDGIHQHGLIWSPQGEPPLPEEAEYAPDVEHFHGPWYLWRENF